jgi:integrase
MPAIQDSIDAYLTEKQADVSRSTAQNHRYQLSQFESWCANSGIDKLSALDPIDLSKFRRARTEALNSNTMYNQLSVLRLYLRFCHRMGWVREELPESIVLPTRSGDARDRSIDPDRAASILDDLESYKYASRDHVVLAVLWTTGARIGGLRALDVDDVHLDEGWIDIQHRPKEGTPLKNASGGEREVNIHGWVADILRDWIDDRRPAVTDSHGRKPLVASSDGRLARSSIRRCVYSLTACAGIDEGCSCGSSYPSRCDDSVAPHDIRRSSISAWLDKGHDVPLVSGRCDVSPKTIEKHYDVRSEAEKRQLRKDAFDM